jgi:hypothetical protein
MIIGLIVLMAASLTGAFYWGRRYPYASVLDAEYNEGTSDEQRKWLRDEMKADQRESRQAPAPVSEPAVPDTGTYEYLYDSQATQKKPSWTYAAPEQSVQDPTAVIADDDDVEAATSYFTALAEDGCGVCDTGADGTCTCTDVCNARECMGWSHSATITSHSGEEHQYSQEAVDTDTMCDHQNREVEDYILKMKADTSSFISKIRVEEAKKYYAEVVDSHNDTEISREIGSWTEPMKAITA